MKKLLFTLFSLIFYFSTIAQTNDFGNSAIQCIDNNLQNADLNSQQLIEISDELTQEYLNSDIEKFRKATKHLDAKLKKSNLLTDSLLNLSLLLNCLESEKQQNGEFNSVSLDNLISYLQFKIDFPDLLKDTPPIKQWQSLKITILLKERNYSIFKLCKFLLCYNIARNHEKEALALKEKQNVENTTSNNKKVVYRNAQTLPIFPGGQDSLRNFVKANIDYPFGIDTINGRVKVEFVVDTTGKVVNCKVVESDLGKAFKNIAIKIAESLPSWTPGKVNGEKVNVIQNIIYDFIPPERFQTPDQDAEFPGGEKALTNYIRTYLKTPYRKKQQEGTCQIGVIINEFGDIEKCTIEKSLGHDFDNEALRLVWSMPRWKPAQKNGRNIAVARTLDVNFSSDTEKLKGKFKTLYIADKMPVERWKSCYRMPKSEDIVPGKVIVKYMVDKFGNVDNVQIHRGLNDACDEAAIISVKLMGWHSGQHNFRSVNVRQMAVFNFYSEKHRHSQQVINKRKPLIVGEGCFYEEKTDDKIFFIVDKMPKYPDGERDFLDFIQKNLRNPSKTQKGKIYLRFVITKEGCVANINVAHGSLGEEFNQEAIRVLKLAQKWWPGVHKGENVNVWYTVPFIFE